jgi:hypothetical protein
MILSISAKSSSTISAGRLRALVRVVIQRAIPLFAKGFDQECVIGRGRLVGSTPSLDAFFGEFA